MLKLLYKPYFGRVKMIYIDPPYNTGNDFIYPDDYAEPLARLPGDDRPGDAEGTCSPATPRPAGATTPPG